MDLFKLLFIFVFFAIVVSLLGETWIIKKKIEILTTNKDDKKCIVKKSITKFYILSMINFLFLGGILAFTFSLQSSGISEFAINFNRVVNNSYKDVNRHELLDKAFDTVLREIDDPYTQKLDDVFSDQMNNINTSIGYSLLFEKDNVFIGDIYSNEIKNIETKDKIISINGIQCSRKIFK